MNGCTRLTTLLVLLSIATPLHAQTATPTSSLTWDQPKDAIVTDAAKAQALTHRYYPDGAPAPGGTVLSNVSCTGTTTITCTTAFPAFTPGTHTLRMTAAVSPIEPESPLSPVLSFSFAVVPSAQTNLRITPTPPTRRPGRRQGGP